MGINHIPIYEGDDDPKLHRFICEKVWHIVDNTNEEKQMSHFGATL
jgi:hypothetical protein